MPIKLVKHIPVQATAASSWGIKAVKADTSPFSGAGVTVAVLDTGIDASHPAFLGVNIVQKDFTGTGNGDGNGHGTHCAGTIFGRDVNGTRIGVARGVSKALIGKVLDGNGGGSSQFLFESMSWALQAGVQVISMSLGFDFPGYVDQLIKGGWAPAPATSLALEAYRANLRMFDALMMQVRAQAAFGPGCVVVAASGNESDRHGLKPFEIAASLPAAADGVVSVGALEQLAAGGLRVATFSNTLPDVSAPGVDIISAKAGGGLISYSGTSMATPGVAGVTALWWEAAKTLAVPLSADSVVAKLLATANTATFAAGVDVGDRGVGLVTAPQ
jgi:subtilisin family serine protease